MPSYHRKRPLKSDCPMEKTLNVISGKWKLALLCELNRNTSRLRDLEQRNPEASKRTLTQQLGELVEDGVVAKKDFDEYPKRTEYSLTKKGESLMLVLDALDEFGKSL